MKKMRQFLVAVFLALGMVSLALAQTTTTTTTLSSAVATPSGGTPPARTITVTSATGFTAGTTGLFVDKEFMLVTAVSGTTITVTRGMNGTNASTHADGARVRVGPLGDGPFSGPFPKKGSCTSTDELFLPQIHVPEAVIYDCLNSQWEAFTIGDSIAVSYVQGPAPADAISAMFFIAPHGYFRVTDIDAVWGIPETTGAMDVQVQRLQGVEDLQAGGGDDLLSAVIDATGADDTVTAGALTATIANRDLAIGDRLGVELTATPNEIADLVVTVRLRIN